MSVYDCYEYKISVKNDGGCVLIITTASSKQNAIEKIMAAEGCPESAILSITKSRTIYEAEKFSQKKLDGIVNNFFAGKCSLKKAWDYLKDHNQAGMIKPLNDHIHDVFCKEYELYLKGYDTTII